MLQKKNNKTTVLSSNEINHKAKLSTPFDNWTKRKKKHICLTILESHPSWNIHTDLGPLRWIRPSFL